MMGKCEQMVIEQMWKDYQKNLKNGTMSPIECLNKARTDLGLEPLQEMTINEQRQAAGLPMLTITFGKKPWWKFW
jgi:hypothetical protein